MEMIQLNSSSVPYEDTNYTGTITNKDSSIHIRSSKILTKKYEIFTYFKLVLPEDTILTSEKELALTIRRDDHMELAILLPIVANIVRVETTQMRWHTWKIIGPVGGGLPNPFDRDNPDSQEEFLNQMRRLQQQPYRQYNPREIPDRPGYDRYGQVTYGLDTTFRPGTIIGSLEFSEGVRNINNSNLSSDAIDINNRINNLSDSARYLASIRSDLLVDNITGDLVNGKS